MEKSAVEWLEKELNAIRLDVDKNVLKFIDKSFEIAKEIEKQQQDESAIEFSKWCLDIGIYNQFKKTQGINKELLEIYKKESNL
jgi:hypothetical protein